MAKQTKKDCYAIMPIADADDYPPNHFLQAYENIIKPFCDMVT